MVGRFEQFCTAIAGIQRSIARIERVEMAKYGLKGAHAQCIIAMSRNPEGITAAQLCELCEKDKAAVSRILAELEQTGMIYREDVTGKRYRTKLMLTEKGNAVAQSVNRTVYLAVSRAGEGYDAENRQTFVRVLNTIAGNLQAICKEGLEDRNISD